MWNCYQGIDKEKGDLTVFLIVTQREAGPRPVCILGSKVCLNDVRVDKDVSCDLSPDIGGRFGDDS